MSLRQTDNLINRQTDRQTDRHTNSNKLNKKYTRDRDNELVRQN